MRVCSIPGCEKRHFGRGLCSMHYAREQRGYKGRGPRLGRRVSRKEVADFVAQALSYAGTECLLWPFGKGGMGYGSGVHKGRAATMHRAICELAHGAAPSNKHHAAHACGTRLCVAPQHLRWATAAENQADRLLHGTDTRGEKHGMAKLTEQDVLAIRAQSWRSGNALAAEYGVGKSTISQIRHRRFWAWLED